MHNRGHVSDLSDDAFNRSNKHVFLLQGGYVFTCGHVLVYQQDFTKTTEQISTKLGWRIAQKRPRVGLGRSTVIAIGFLQGPINLIDCIQFKVRWNG